MIEYVIYGMPAETGWKDWLPPILSAAAAALSAIAAVVSVWLATRSIKFSAKQTELLETHNKLSVTPHIDGHTYSDVSANFFSYTITNNGAGPAIITEAFVYYDESLQTRPNALLKAISKLFDNGPAAGSPHTYRYASAGNGQYITPGTSIEIFAVDKAIGETCLSLGARFEDKFHLVINYKSIYDQSFIFDSKSQTTTSLAPPSES